MADENPTAWGATPIEDGGPTSWGAVPVEAPQQPEISTAQAIADVPLSAGIGVAKGGIGLAGLPGDVRELAAKGASKAAGAFGYEVAPETISKGLKFLPLPGAAGPTSQQIREPIESVTGEFYKPKTTAGEYAQTIGEFAPGVIGGPAGLVPKVAGRVVAPALASESAGQVARQVAPEAEPYARIVGGIAGGAPFVRGVKQSIPAIDNLKQAARENYKHPEVLALEIQPSAINRFADSAVQHLTDNGFRATSASAPRTFALIDELREVALPTAKIADIDKMRKAFQKVASNFNNAEDQEAARQIIRGIDNYLPALKQADLVAGDAAKAMPLLADARANWAAAKHGETLLEKMTAADLQAAATYSGGNLDNAIRQKVKSILVSPKLRRGYSKEELDAMERIVRGTMTGNAARKAGKILGGGGGLGTTVAAEVGAHAIGTPGYGVPIIGSIARKVAEGSTQRGAERLNEMVRSRSPEAAAWRAIQSRTASGRPLSPATQALLRGLYGSEHERLLPDQAKP